MKTRKLLVHQILFICWSVVIVTLTSIPKLKTPSSEILEIDKLAHFGVYLIFTWLLVKISRKNGKDLIRSLMMWALIIPFLDEIHQIPIPGREFSIYDVGADMIGFGVVIASVYFKLVKPIRS
jgi:VanZ family protein